VEARTLATSSRDSCKAPRCTRLSLVSECLINRTTPLPETHTRSLLRSYIHSYTRLAHSHSPNDGPRNTHTRTHAIQLRSIYAVLYCQHQDDLTVNNDA